MSNLNFASFLYTETSFVIQCWYPHLCCQWHEEGLSDSWIKYKQRLLLRRIHHFKSDYFNNMDHMRISVTEPSSEILSQESSFKNWKEMSKSAKTCWSQKEWCNKPTELQIRLILKRKILMLPNATNQRKSIAELSYMCHRGIKDTR